MGELILLVPVWPHMAFGRTVYARKFGSPEPNKGNVFRTADHSPLYSIFDIWCDCCQMNWFGLPRCMDGAHVRQNISHHSHARIPLRICVFIENAIIWWKTDSKSKERNNKKNQFHFMIGRTRSQKMKIHLHRKIRDNIYHTFVSHAFRLSIWSLNLVSINEILLNDFPLCVLGSRHTYTGTGTNIHTNSQLNHSID